MKFLCLGYFDREAMGALSEAEVDALMTQCKPHMGVYQGTGQVLVDAGLDLRAKSLRRRNGTLAITDGPFVETKEMVGGTFIIDAADMDDAIRVASLHPATQVLDGERFGWGLEIRPIHYFKTPETPEVTWQPPVP
ncbi:hypothetical protein BWI17_02335 [Betaproteobacteria bacterium GR16-43]|nr:hypothetical protein BWI17_02335 [Betaproteobacteria bacterium GR16-43]